MKIVSVEQNTKEWHDWRNEGIGASDIPTILGVNPYKTRSQFIVENITKTKLFKGNADTRRGHELEPFARDKANNSGFNFSPICAEWEEDNFLRASLDGFDEKSNVILEVKAPRKFYPTIPVQYQYQVQAQLLVTGAEYCVFYQILKYGDECLYRHEVIKRNELIHDQIRSALKQIKIELKIDPGYTDEEVLWKHYIEAKKKSQEAELRLKIAEAALKGTLLDHERKIFVSDDGSKYVMSKTLRKGSVDYQSIPELKSIDLDQYRKGETEVVSIREDRGNVDDL